MVEEKQKKKFGSFLKRKKVVEPVKKTAAVSTKKAAPATPVVPEPVAPPLPNVDVISVVLTPKKRKESWLSRTEYFKKLSNWAFEMVDTDESGEVDEKVRVCSCSPIINCMSLSKFHSHFIYF
jgi:hypothetical protein